MKIPFKGLVRNTPAGLAQDGELEDVCNVRYKDGAWRPIPDRVAVFGGETLPYTNIFVHSNAGYKHYLGLKQDGTFEYFAADNDDNIPTLLETADIKVLTTLTAGATITQIGNVININNNGLKYLIWYDNAYVLIDSNFDGAQDSTELLGRVDLKVDMEEPIIIQTGNGDFLAYKTWYIRSENRVSDTDIELKKETSKALYIKMRGLMKSAGLLHGFCLACTAVELFDGTYILHSQPVLLGQSNDANTRYSDGINDYITNQKVFYIDTQNGAGDKEENGIYYLNINGPELPNTRIGSSNPSSSNSVYIGVNTYANKLKVKVNSTIDERYKVLVKSISVFLTPEIDMLNETKQLTSKTDSWNVNIYLQPKTNTEIIKELSELKNFYKVHEIPFDEIKTTTENDGWIPIDLKDKLGDSLLTLQRLPIDNFSHHTTLPEVQFVYNSKLHIANYKTELSRGWPYGYMQAIQGIGQFASETLPISTITLATSIKTTNGISIVKRIGEYNGVGMPAILSYPDSRATDIIMYYQSRWIMMSTTELLQVKQLGGYPTDLSYWSNEENTEKTLAKLVNFSNETISSGAKSNARYILGKHEFTYNRNVQEHAIGEHGKYGTVFKVEQINGVFYYTEVSPTVLATITWTIAINSYCNKEIKYKLTPSNSFNFSSWINPELRPQSILSSTGKSFTQVPSESNRQQIYQNTLKVSEVNNPFIFPSANTYQIGNGDIIGLASNTVALSTGQFGQFPVYVFCTDGIYGLYVGGADINYSSSRPVSREVCNNAHSIKAIDTGVIFTTDKGVMVLVGSEVKELSEPLKGGVFDINKLSLFKQALNHVKLTQLLPEFTSETIHDYIKAAIVGYNYVEREIWFTNPNLSYSYIFSQGAWYKVKQTGTKYIDDYPKQYILEDGKLIDIASETGTYQQIYFLTRPVKMGDVEFKQMLTAAIRGRMLVENVQGTPVQKKWAGIHVYGSYDGERWVFLGGNEKNGELNDFGTRVERTDCKYFRIAFYGNINNESYINYLELEGKQSILSTKLR